MASLLKPWIVRYLDANGRQVPKGSPEARKVKERTSKWYGQFTDAEGRRRRVPLCADKAASRQMLAALEKESLLGRAGVVDHFAAHRKASIETHLIDYENHFRNKGVCEEYRVENVRRLRLVLEHGKVKALGDIRPEVVERYLTLLSDRGVGTTTRNNYLSSAKAFTKWCVATGRAGEDVLACLKRAKGVIRRKRRALTLDELTRLLKTARERPFLEVTTIRSGTGKGTRVADTRKPETRAWAERLGRERALIYKTLVYTGLRRGELEALEVRNLTLSGPRPGLNLPGSATKNGEAADIPIKADLVRDLAAWIEATGKTGSDRLFRVPKELNRILKRDMKWAGIAYKDDRGHTIDVHSMRHTTGTYLGRGKVTPRVAQGFMRHADIKLTMQTYSDPRLMDEAEALAALPDLPIDLEGDDKS